MEKLPNNSVSSELSKLREVSYEGSTALGADVECWEADEAPLKRTTEYVGSAFDADATTTILPFKKHITIRKRIT